MLIVELKYGQKCLQGGQILRTAISLSAILGIPVRVTNIRANRSKPGLAAQHLIGKLTNDCLSALAGRFPQKYFQKTSKIL